MADITLSYKGNTIATMSASGSKTIQTAGKYCEDDITLNYTRPDEILYNPSFNINTTGLLSWDASNSGAGEFQGVKAIDGWYLMNSIATQTTPGLTVTAKQTDAFLLQQINSYFGRMRVTLSVIVDNTEYHLTDVISSSTGSTSINIDTSWGNIYVYVYAQNRIFVNIHFMNQVNISHTVNSVNLKVS